MGRFLKFLSLAVVILALLAYRHWPSFPEDMENRSMGNQVFNAIGVALFRGLITAEGFNLIDCSVQGLNSMFANLQEKNLMAMSKPNVIAENTTLADVPVLIIRPPADQDDNTTKAAIVYFHGGGFVFGTTLNHFPWTQRLAVEGNIVIISVDYRLGPQHPYPAAVDDCVKVTKAVFDNAKKLNIDSGRIIVGGDSAGGNLAAVVAVELANLLPKYKLKAQLLISPVMQALDMAALPSYKKYGHLFAFPMQWMIVKYAGLPYSNGIHSLMLANQHVKSSDLLKYERYLNVSSLGKDITSLMAPGELLPNEWLSNENVEDDSVLREVRKLALSERAWPLLADDKKLANVAPAFFTVAEYDCLRDENLLYYERLRSLKIKVVLSYLPKAAHCAPVIADIMGQPMTESSRKGIADIVAFLKEYAHSN